MPCSLSSSKPQSIACPKNYPSSNYLGLKVYGLFREAAVKQFKQVDGGVEVCFTVLLNNMNFVFIQGALATLEMKLLGGLLKTFLAL